jgi:hypothetical protein
MVNTRKFLPVAVLLAVAVSAQAHGLQQDRVLTSKNIKRNFKRDFAIGNNDGGNVISATSNFKSKALETLEPYESKRGQVDVSSWLTEVNDVLDQVSTGAFASVETKFIKTVSSISTDVVNAGFIEQKEVLEQVLDLFPSLWKTALSYVKLDVWKPIFSNIFIKCFEHAKKCEQTNENALRQLSRMIRITKDNVFPLGEDKGNSTGMAHEEYLPFLAELVSFSSKVEGFEVDTARLRAFMNTLPSKKDGMDTNVAFPVFVDTSKYATSDAKALEAFLYQKD